MKKRTLVFLAALLAVQWASAMTLAELRTEIRVRIKDTNSSRQRYSNTQILNLINEAQRDVNNAAWVLAKTYSGTIFSGTTFYTLPTDTIAILRATREYKLLKETTLDKLDADFNGGAWFNAGGVPTQFYQDIANPSQVGLYPWPSGSSSTGTLRIDYIAQTSDLSSDSDEPFLGEERYRPYHDLLIFYVCYRIFLIEGDARAQIYREEYESRLMVMRERVGRKPAYNPGFSGDRGK